MWIHLADECEFLLSPPAFDLLFAGDRVSHVGVGFDVDQARDIVFFRETGVEFLFVFGNAAVEVIGDARIEHAGRVGKNVDVVDGHFRGLLHEGGWKGYDKDKHRGEWLCQRVE